MQFRFDDATCEAYWVSYDSSGRKSDESWQKYVERTAEETRIAFQRVCREIDFHKLAHEWEFIQKKMDESGINPLNHLWFVLYFEAPPSTSA